MPVLCLTEVAQLVGGRGGWRTEVRLLMSTVAGELSVESFHPADAKRTAELVSVYRNLPLGTVDASVVAAAERLDVRTIAALDRRHLGAVRPEHVEALELVP